MRSIIFILLVFLSLIFIRCGENESFPKQQYVIEWYGDEDPNDPDWFKVVNIHTKKFQPVPAVKELEGNYYLPIMSRWPSFNNKVVEGEFFIDSPFGSLKADTVFKVTKHLRDTTIYH